MSAPTAQKVAKVNEHPANKVYDEGEALEEDEVEEEIEEEIEEYEEVTDNEDDRSVSHVTQEVAQPVGKPTGKVEPSKEVKNLKMRSPQSDAVRIDKLPANLNPMKEIKNWSKELFDDIVIDFPVLTSALETTNELTRRTRPEARFWKGNIRFAARGHTSDTLLVNNVAIPYSDNNKYGVAFVYLCLPGYMADNFGQSGKKRRATVVDEKSLVRDPERWWKIANDVDGKFGVAVEETGKFRPTPLPTIFNGTQKGIICNVELQFVTRANTEDSRPLGSTDSQRVGVDIVRAYVLQTGVDVQPPARVPRTKRSADPSRFTPDNYASDDLLKKLAQLGI